MLDYILVTCHNVSLSIPLSDEFMISPVEGELRVRKDAELDRETTAFYNITVTARDLGTPSRNSSVGLLYIHSETVSIIFHLIT